MIAMVRGNGESDATRQGDWSDPDIPVGNSPPTGPWLLVLAAVAWLSGITFLIVMASWRLLAG
jgi:hypothetical protein